MGKKWTKKLSLILAAVMLVSIMGLFTGCGGKEMTWEITEDGKLIVEGTAIKPTEDDDDWRWPWFSDPRRGEIKTAKFAMSGATDLYGLCGGLNNLKSVDFSELDTSKVKNMAMMFSGCHSLTDLDLSSFDTSKVEDMAGMFSNCQSLTDLDLSGFDTSNVTCMTMMFSGCSNLTDLDLSSFDTSNVQGIWVTGIFADCSNLSHITVGEKWSIWDKIEIDESKVTIEVK